MESLTILENLKTIKIERYDNIKTMVKYIFSSEINCPRTSTLQLQWLWL